MLKGRGLGGESAPVASAPPPTFGSFEDCASELGSERSEGEGADGDPFGTFSADFGDFDDGGGLDGGFDGGFDAAFEEPAGDMGR